MAVAAISHHCVGMHITWPPVRSLAPSCLRKPSTVCSAILNERTAPATKSAAGRETLAEATPAASGACKCGSCWKDKATSAAAASAAAALLLASPFPTAEAAAMAPPQHDTQHVAQLMPLAQHFRSSSVVAEQRALPLQRLAAVGDLSLSIPGLPKTDNPFRILGYLLRNPVAALIVGGGLAWAIPRLVRMGIRYLVIPAAFLLVLFLAVRNPVFAWGAVKGAVAAVTAHPIATSAVILVGSSLMLSPYILAAGLAVVLITGTKIMPPFLRPTLPGPVNEAFREVDKIQAGAKSALQQLGAAIRPAPALKDGRK